MAMAAAPEKPRYKAVATSPLVSGEVELDVKEDSLMIASPLSALEVRYEDLASISPSGYDVVVRTDDLVVTLSRMGSWAEAFRESLSKSFRDAALKAFHEEGDPETAAAGFYRRSGPEGEEGFQTPMQVRKDCIMILPPDLGVRRLPLRFVVGVEKSGLSLTLVEAGGVRNEFTKLGGSLAPFTRAVEDALRGIATETTQELKRLCPLLDSTEAANLSRLMPQRRSASWSDLEASPKFTAALTERFGDSKAGRSLKAFLEMCGPENVFVGCESAKEEKAAAALPGMPGMAGMPDVSSLMKGGMPDMGSLMSGGPQDAKEGEEKKEEFTFRFIALAPDGNSASVEWSEDDVATYVYRTGGDGPGFVRKLDRAMEAIGLTREPIRLSDEDLRKSDNPSFRMAVRLDRDLKLARRSYVGRVIHSSEDSWRRKLQDIWSSGAEARGEVVKEAPWKCPGCGSALEPTVRFCRRCGRPTGR